MSGSEAASNEALNVSFIAMSGKNLRAVDRVVKVVRVRLLPQPAGTRPPSNRVGGKLSASGVSP